MCVPEFFIKFLSWWRSSEKDRHALKPIPNFLETSPNINKLEVLGKGFVLWFHATIVTPVYIGFAGTTGGVVGVRCFVQYSSFPVVQKASYLSP